MDKIAAIDIGNSTTRWGLWAEGGFVHLDSCPTAEVGKKPLFPKSETVQVAAVTSVVPETEEKLVEAVERELGVAPQFLGRDLPVPLEIKVDEPAKVGADRIAAALAAHRSSGAAVVVDFGTAITVDAVTAAGVFVGGAILPGPGLCLESLAAGTAGVKLGGDVAAVTPPGRSTREAVDAALSYGLAGAVDRLVEETRATLGDRTALIATGGGAGFFLPLCETIFARVPNLVLEGLVVAALESA